MASHLAPFQDAFVERLSELGIAYRGSPIVDGAGARFFDQSLRGGNGIKRRYVLFCDDRVADSVKAALHTFVGAASECLELRLEHYRGLTLVRPDGYVAFSSSAIRESALHGVRDVLDRQLANGTPA
jgi:hypothetical protein